MDGIAMFDWFKRKRGSGTEGDPLSNSWDWDTLARAASITATFAVSSQKASLLQMAKIDVSRDPVIRFASDAFVVGYAVGVGSGDVRMQRRDIRQMPVEYFLDDLHQRLGEHFDNLDVVTLYRGGSSLLSCGIALGLCEPGDLQDYSILEHAGAEWTA